MDDAVSIERRLGAMKAFHDAGVRTTCFISPIFPGITDLPSIIRRAKDRCNLVWLENLNLRGGYKKTILDYIAERHPDLVSLYDTIYNKGDRTYWAELDAQMREFCKDEGLIYVRDDDSIRRPFEDPPILSSTTSSTRNSLRRQRGRRESNSGVRHHAITSLYEVQRFNSTRNQSFKMSRPKCSIYKGLPLKPMPNQVLPSSRFPTLAYFRCR